MHKLTLPVDIFSRLFDTHLRYVTIVTIKLKSLFKLIVIPCKLTIIDMSRFVLSTTYIYCTYYTSSIHTLDELKRAPDISSVNLQIDTLRKEAGEWKERAVSVEQELNVVQSERMRDQAGLGNIKKKLKNATNEVCFYDILLVSFSLHLLCTPYHTILCKAYHMLFVS